MFQRIIQFIKKEAVLSLSIFFAAISMLLVPPDSFYLHYLDLRVLCLMFCLMTVIAGFEVEGVFSVLSQKVLSGGGSIRRLYYILVFLPFFSSMLVTNDVALLTFVPLALLVLTKVCAPWQLMYTVSLQTIAANLGSMLTPVGNPQNLFLHSFYQLDSADFFSVTAPVVLLSLLLLLLSGLPLRGGTVTLTFDRPARLLSSRRVWVYALLFLFCLLAVFRVIPYPAVTALILAVMLYLDRGVLKRVDYSLLLTFVCFFIFAGNLSRLDALKNFLRPLLEQHTMPVSLLVSQVISNVPAAVLLAPFTADSRGLILGSNLGGLGTLVASLASLISFRLYLRLPQSKALPFLAVFTAANLIFLLLLLGFCLCLL